jgi:hypothetical protein
MLISDDWKMTGESGGDELSAGCPWIVALLLAPPSAKDEEDRKREGEGS